jgi:hypothetical protein
MDTGRDRDTDIGKDWDRDTDTDIDPEEIYAYGSDTPLKIVHRGMRPHRNVFRVLYSTEIRLKKGLIPHSNLIPRKNLFCRV